MIWFDAAATNFTESAPLGNGWLGAMMFCGVNDERIACHPNAPVRNFHANCHLCSFDMIGFREMVIVIASVVSDRLIVQGAKRNGKVGRIEP